MYIQNDSISLGLKSITKYFKSACNYRTFKKKTISIGQVFFVKSLS